MKKYCLTNHAKVELQAIGYLLSAFGIMTIIIVTCAVIMAYILEAHPSFLLTLTAFIGYAVTASVGVISFKRWVQHSIKEC